MKAILKELLKSTAISIGIATAFFCAAGTVFDAANHGSVILENYQFTKMVIGCIFTGLGFGVPSVIYSKESLPMPVKVLIHMGTGCAVYTVVAYLVGWINRSASLPQIMLAVALQLSAAFLIWALFMIYYRKEAKLINDRIQELKQKENRDK